MDGRASLSVVDDEDAAQKKHLRIILDGLGRVKRVWGGHKGTTRVGGIESNVNTSIEW